MESIQSFAMEMQEGYILMSWDFMSVYWHFYLHAYMRYFFLFRDGVLYYWCI